MQEWKKNASDNLFAVANGIFSQNLWKGVGESVTLPELDVGESTYLFLSPSTSSKQRAESLHSKTAAVLESSAAPMA